MADRETLTLWARDFFGETTDATLTFLKGDSIVFRESFKDGYMTIELPNQLDPGVYDILAERGDAQYRINNFVLPLASLFFKHAHTHEDIKLTRDNFSDDKIEDFKFDPLLHQYIRRMPPDLKKTFDDISKYSHNQNTVRWGGLITLDDQINISRGEASINGRLYEWEDTTLEVPHERGRYNMGLKDGEFEITEEPLDMNFAIVYRESNDWVRMNVDLKYHTIARASHFFYFTEYEQSSDIVEVLMDTPEMISGVMNDDLIYGRGQLNVPVEEVELNYSGDEGPVLRTDKLYIYATPNYFLLWEGNTLLTALPRFQESNLKLDWQKELYFSSWGIDGSARWTRNVPYLPSHIWFFEGATPEPYAIPLTKRILDSRVISTEDFDSWSGASSSTGSSISWNNIGI